MLADLRFYTYTHLCTNGVKQPRGHGKFPSPTGSPPPNTLVVCPLEDKDIIKSCSENVASTSKTIMLRKKIKERRFKSRHLLAEYPRFSNRLRSMLSDLRLMQSIPPAGRTPGFSHVEGGGHAQAADPCPLRLLIPAQRGLLSSQRLTNSKTADI